MGVVAQNIEVAARYISSGRPTTRRFDSCFEWWGADAVAVGLYRRTLKRPNTKLAQNLFKYLGRESVMAAVDKYQSWQDLEALGLHLLKENGK